MTKKKNRKGKKGNVNRRKKKEEGKRVNVMNM